MKDPDSLNDLKEKIIKLGKTLFLHLKETMKILNRSEKIRESQRKFFQIKNKYIVCPVKSGLMLIDQKRAHERILYEKFLECLSNEQTVSQTDMFPVTVELNPADYFILKEIERALRFLDSGFSIPEIIKLL